MAVIARLDPDRLDVEPGAQATVVLRVRNGGTIVDRFNLSVVGPMGPWARVEPASLHLFPDQQGEATILFAPPRAPQPLAGTYPFGVQVVPAAGLREAVVEEGRLTVRPFAEAAAEMVPQTSRGGRSGRHDIVVDNRGNAPMQAAVAASDPDRLLRFRVSPEAQVIEPGRSGQFWLRASAVQMFLTGPRRTVSFAAEVRPDGAPPITLRGALSQGAILPGWVIPAIGLLGAAVLAVILLPQVLGLMRPVTSTGPATPPSSASIGSPSAGPQATEPSSGQPPTASPSQVTAAPVQIRFHEIRLGQPGQDITEDQVTIHFRFGTDGPGPVTVRLRRLLDADPKLDSPLRLCLGPLTGGAICRELSDDADPVADALTLRNDTGEPVQWEATIVNRSQNFAPRVDLDLEFPASRPRLRFQNEAAFNGDPNFFSANFDTFAAQVTGRAEVPTVDVVLTFGGQLPSFRTAFHSLADTTLPWTSVSGVDSWGPTPFPVSSGTTYEFLFQGLLSDATPGRVGYEATFDW